MQLTSKFVMVVVLLTVVEFSIFLFTVYAHSIAPAFSSTLMAVETLFVCVYVSWIEYVYSMRTRSSAFSLAQHSLDVYTFGSF